MGRKVFRADLVPTHKPSLKPQFDGRFRSWWWECRHNLSLLRVDGTVLYSAGVWEDSVSRGLLLRVEAGVQAPPIWEEGLCRGERLPSHPTVSSAQLIRHVNASLHMPGSP